MLVKLSWTTTVTVSYMIVCQIVTYEVENVLAGGSDGTSTVINFSRLRVSLISEFNDYTNRFRCMSRQSGSRWNVAATTGEGAGHCMCVIVLNLEIDLDPQKWISGS